MHSFQDKNGRSWSLTVNVGTMKRVRSLCGIDLFNIIELDKNQNPKTDVLEKLTTDPILLVDVIYAVCKEEADKIGISDEDFGRSMCGDTIEAATNALLDEIVDFFPAAKRQVYLKVLTASRRFKIAAEKQLAAILNDESLDKKLEMAMEKAFGSVTDTPESSD